MNRFGNVLVATLIAGGLGAPAVAQEPRDAAMGESQHTLADFMITDAVSDALRLDDGVSAHLIDVETDNGIVTLAGTVDNLLAKDRSRDIAESIKGVRAVVNRIEVMPAMEVPDERLVQHVRDALLMDPATDSFEIAVAATDGDVTLEGLVDSWVERDLAGEVARSVAGVHSVENRITVEHVERSDSEIANDIRGLLQNDIWVDAGAIGVDVEEGVVTLSGYVGSAQEKRRAGFHAWLNGVRRVDDSQLQVRWWAREEIPRKDRDAKVSDDEVRKAVKAAFLFDPRVYSFEPEVSVRDGVATLSGTVDNLRAKRAASQDARNTVGVWRVRDYLRVRTAESPTEAEIVKRIESALERNPYLVRSEIQPVVINQKVYLYGTVNSEFEREQAETATASVNGVVAIDNHLEVAPALARTALIELQQEIEDALWWNPFVDASQVRVAVDGDTVVLDGNVDSWREWTAADQCARSCGAEHVRNRLRVGDSKMGAVR